MYVEVLIDLDIDLSAFCLTLRTNDRLVVVVSMSYKQVFVIRIIQAVAEGIGKEIVCVRHFGEDFGKVSDLGLSCCGRLVSHRVPAGGNMATPV
jgi:hypothetical protein